jgi:hypothetical protein
MKKLLLLLLLPITSTLYSQVTVINDTILTGAGFAYQCSNPIDTFTFTYDTTNWGAPPPCNSFFGVNLDWVQVYIVDDTIDTNPNVQFDVFFRPLFMDSNGIQQEGLLQHNFLPFNINASGCYQFETQFLCPEGDTILFVGTWNIQVASIEELEISENRKLVRITDLMGRECLPESNKVLIYYYSDGTKVKTLKQQEQ